MKQLCDVHMLPTDDSTAIYRDINNKLKKQYHQGAMGQYFHIYLTTDEEIKDWMLYQDEKVAYAKNIEYMPKSTPAIAYQRNGWRKIVATSNSELWAKNLIGAGMDKVRAGGIARIPESFVKAYISAYNAGSPIKQVMLEYEEQVKPQREDIPFEKAKVFVTDYKRPKLNSDASVIWSLKEEKMYSRQDLVGILAKYDNDNHLLPFNRRSIEEWLDMRYPQ